MAATCMHVPDVFEQLLLVKEKPRRHSSSAAAYLSSKAGNGQINGHSNGQQHKNKSSSATSSAHAKIPLPSPSARSKKSASPRKQAAPGNTSHTFDSLCTSLSVGPRVSQLQFSRRVTLECCLLCCDCSLRFCGSAVASRYTSVSHMRVQQMQESLLSLQR